MCRWNEHDKVHLFNGGVTSVWTRCYWFVKLCSRDRDLEDDTGGGHRTMINSVEIIWSIEKIPPFSIYKIASKLGIHGWNAATYLRKNDNPKDNLHPSKCAWLGNISVRLPTHVPNHSCSVLCHGKFKLIAIHVDRKGAIFTIPEDLAILKSLKFNRLSRNS